MKTILSMVIYTFSMGACFGIVKSTVFTVLLLIHELGHLFALRRLGIKHSSPLFLPFIGAIINVNNDDMSSEEEALVGIFGPLVGGVTAIIAYELATAMQLPEEVITGTVLGLFFNVINLAPITPLDGGRVVQVLGRWILIPAFSLLVCWSHFMFSPVLIIIWLGFIGEVFNVKPVDLPISKRLFYSGAYLCLVLNFTASLLTMHSSNPILTPK